MRSESEPDREYEFDWFLQPDDIADDEGEVAEYVWQVPEIIDRFPELEVETILTSEGQWHKSESGLWDEPGWVEKARTEWAPKLSGAEALVPHLGREVQMPCILASGKKVKKKRGLLQGLGPGGAVFVSLYSYPPHLTPLADSCI